MSMHLLINTYLTCSGNTVNIHQISKEFTILVRLLCLLQKLASSYKDVIITDLFARRITCRMNFIQHVQIMYMLNKIHPLFLFKFQSGRQFVFIGNSNRKFPFNMFKGWTKSAHGESGGAPFHFPQLVGACGDWDWVGLEATFATAFGNL